MKKGRIYWWKGKDLEPVVALLCSKGLANVRLEFHTGSGLLHVVDTTTGAVTESHEPGTNFVHVCPPDCPEE